MPEPLTTGALIAKAASAAASDAGKDTTSLLKRLLGPSVDEFAEALRRSVAYRTRNFGRIAARADAKSGAAGCDGMVNQRLAYVMLDEGSLCDDELMAEYLGGLLAGSRSPSGRDDRAVAWCRIVSGMSWLQVRAHFLLYREWAARLYGRSEVELGQAGRSQARMYAELNEFVKALVGDSGIDQVDALQDAILGLDALNLIEPMSCAFGSKAGMKAIDSPYDQVLRVEPSVRGLELYGWAQGLPGISMDDFTTKAVAFDTEPPVTRLVEVALPRLPTPPPTQEAAHTVQPS